MELNDGHFQLWNDMMILNIKGSIVVFFQQSNCPACQKIKPYIQKLAQNDTRVRFGFVDVQRYQSIAKMSVSTQTRITQTPFFIFYHEGKPIAKYSGGGKNSPPDVDGVVRLINQCLMKIQVSHSESFDSTAAPVSRGQGSNGEIYKPSKESNLSIPNDITPYTDPWKKPTH